MVLNIQHGINEPATYIFFFIGMLKTHDYSGRFAPFKGWPS